MKGCKKIPIFFYFGIVLGHFEVNQKRSKISTIEYKDESHQFGYKF